MSDVYAFKGFDNGLADDYVRLHEPDDLTGSPGWTTEVVPKLKYVPVYTGEPKVVGTELLPYPHPGIAVCPDATEAILWFTPTHLALTDFSLTVRREVRPDGSVATSGASAILSVSVYVQQGVQHLVTKREAMLDVVSLPLARTEAYTLFPGPQHGLSVALDLPAGVASAPPDVTVSPLAGSATIAVELTEAGALSWRAALEQGAGSTLPGVVRATVAIPSNNAVDPDGFELWYPSVETHQLDTPVATLLASRGPGDIRQIDPQQTVQATVLVIGSQLVDTTTVTMRPSGDLAPTSDTFGAGGGRLDASVVSQHPETVAIEWQADVSFSPPRWPVVRVSGRLDRTAGWTTMIKPESWCVGYLLAIVPVDASGRPVPAGQRASDRVQGVLNFTAPYVGLGVLTSAFEAEYGRPTSLVLPRHPEHEFGELVLTVFATVNDKMGQATRRLSADEVVVTALVFPGGRVELHTSQDTLPEAAAGVSALLTRLTKLTAD